MTHRPAPDLARLAASLRLMACGVMAELLALLGLCQLAGALRRRMARDVAQLERFATGIVVLTALKSLPMPPDLRGRGCFRPFCAPPGFRRIAGADRAMRALQRRLFPKIRDLTLRISRLHALLDDVAAAARKLLRPIAQVPPATRLILILAPVSTVPALSPSFAVPVADSS